MIEITVNRNGSTSAGNKTLTLSNRFENFDEQIKFSFPPELSGHYAYVVAFHVSSREQIVLPIRNQICNITLDITKKYGDWLLYAMLREHELDLKSEVIDFSKTENEHVFVSDYIKGKVKLDSINDVAKISDKSHQNEIIETYRGDTFTAKLEITDDDGNSYTPAIDDKVTFTLKEVSNTVLVKEIPIDTLVLTLLPEETEKLESGKYEYSVVMRKSDGNVFTIMDSTLNLLNEVS